MVRTRLAEGSLESPAFSLTRAICRCPDGVRGIPGRLAVLLSAAAMMIPGCGAQAPAGAPIGGQPQQTATARATTPYSGSPIPIPGTVEAENFDNGGEGSAYHDSTA